MLKKYFAELEANGFCYFNLGLCFEDTLFHLECYVRDNYKIFRPKESGESNWFVLKVDSKVAKDKTHGTGVNPYHIDYHNHLNPPRFIIFVCQRPDPSGGGVSHISSIDNALSFLNEIELTYLKETNITYPCFDLEEDNLGGLLKSYKIIGSNDQLVRYTEKLNPHIESKNGPLDLYSNDYK
ncbi:TauD/TfdA family dioxygenase, partial [Vibrio hyugaensis]|uniref:TauD/TfdA family dioxygenase n=1 Tax=Vibrio hyugaensis TaxID=1534743 RepID=UPI0011AFF2B6